MEKRKKISVCCSAYNEESNILEFYVRVLKQLKKFPQYDYEFIIADNCSTDRTREILREIALKTSMSSVFSMPIISDLTVLPITLSCNVPVMP